MAAKGDVPEQVNKGARGGNMPIVERANEETVEEARRKIADDERELERREQERRERAEYERERREYEARQRHQHERMEAEARKERADARFRDMRLNRWVFTMQVRCDYGQKRGHLFKKGTEVPLDELSREQVDDFVNRDLIEIENKPLEKPMGASVLSASTTAPPAWQRAQTPQEPEPPKFRG
jgi:hypothetical protein